MSRTSFIVLAIVSYVFLPISEIDGLPTVKNHKSILDEIKSDESICPTYTVFSKSRYAKSCQDVNLPVNNETLNNTNEQQFLCVGFYQRIQNVCFLSSTSKLARKVLPENSTVFDTTVEKSFLNNSTNAKTFCNNWKYVDPSNYTKTNLYVVQLEKALNNSITCIKMCSTFSRQVEPLCAVLASMNEISDKLQAETKQSVASGREGISKDAEANGARVADPEPAKKKIDQGKPQNKVIGGSQTPTNVAEAALQKIVKAMKPNEQTSATSDTKITEPESQKPETVRPVDTKAHVVNEPKEESVAKEKANDAEQNLSKPLIVDQKKEEPASPKNKPQTGDDQASAHENSEENLEKNSPGIEQEDDNTDVISQHTQDDDITVDRRPSEDVNEIESPILPTVEENVNENHAQAPENYGFVPRLPGIRDDDDSHFFGYFTVIGVICIAGYVGYHNKQKILAMVLEGRRSRGGRGRRRPSTANYRKLDCTLEEAVTSQCNSNVTHVIY